MKRNKELKNQNQPTILSLHFFREYCYLAMLVASHNTYCTGVYITSAANNFLHTTEAANNWCPRRRHTWATRAD